MPQGNFPPTAAPLPDWLATVQAAHSGLSAQAGYHADAVARVVAALGDMLKGNRDLAELAHKLGATGAAAAVNQRAIFLSYASTDRTDVDALYHALAAKAPGLTLFQDHRSIALGQEWLATIRAAAGSASVIACWVTPAFLQRTFCSYEIGIGETQGATVVPVWVDGLDPRGAPAYCSGKQGLAAPRPFDFDAIAGALTALL